MSPLPLITVITPTWNRNGLLFGRCIPGVRDQQGWPEVEHLVVSDGPDPELRLRLAPGGPDGHRACWYRELDEHDPTPHWGHIGRQTALAYAAGEFVTYCDSDDRLRARHCYLLGNALLANPKAGFAVSRMMSHSRDGEQVIGHGPLAPGNVGTPMLMHRRWVEDIATWDHAGQFEDWDLVSAWLGAEVPYVHVDAETVDVYPSIFWGS